MANNAKRKKKNNTSTGLILIVLILIVIVLGVILIVINKFSQKQKEENEKKNQVNLKVNSCSVTVPAQHLYTSLKVMIVSDSWLPSSESILTMVPISSLLKVKVPSLGATATTLIPKAVRFKSIVGVVFSDGIKSDSSP